MLPSFLACKNVNLYVALLLVLLRVLKTAHFLKPVNRAKKDRLTVTYLKVLVTRRDTKIVYAGLRILLVRYGSLSRSRHGRTAGSQKQLTSPCCGRCPTQLAWALKVSLKLSNALVTGSRPDATTNGCTGVATSSSLNRSDSACCKSVLSRSSLRPGHLGGWRASPIIG